MFSYLIAMHNRIDWSESRCAVSLIQSDLLSMFGMYILYPNAVFVTVILTITNCVAATYSPQHHLSRWPPHPTPPLLSLSCWPLPHHTAHTPHAARRARQEWSQPCQPPTIRDNGKDLEDSSTMNMVSHIRIFLAISHHTGPPTRYHQRWEGLEDIDDEHSKSHPHVSHHLSPHRPSCMRPPSLSWLTTTLLVHACLPCTSTCLQTLLHAHKHSWWVKPHTTTPSHLPSHIPALPFSHANHPLMSTTTINHPLSLAASHLLLSPSRVNQCQPPPRPELLDAASNRHGELVDMTSMLTWWARSHDEYMDMVSMLTWWVCWHGTLTWWQTQWACGHNTWQGRNNVYSQCCPSSLTTLCVHMHACTPSLVHSIHSLVCTVDTLIYFHYLICGPVAE